MVKRATQQFMGRNQLVDRLTAQIGDRDTAMAVLRKRGQMDAKGELTALGRQRDQMTAQERALDRAHRQTGRPVQDFTYNPTTNRATARPGTYKSVFKRK